MFRPIAIALAALALPGSAQAAVPPYITTQAQMVRGEFLLDLEPPASAGSACVIDTGVSVTANVAPRMVSVVTSNGVAMSGSTLHGTNVSSILGNTSPFMPGIFPSANIHSVKADVDKENTFYNKDLLAAVAVCRSYGDVQVISMSLGGYSEYPAELVAAITDAISSGISVVAAAGNSRDENRTTLARIPGVISVGGVDVFGGRCSSTLDPDVSLVALGCNVEVVSSTSGQAENMAGTSGAAPQVSAALLALRAYQPSLDARAAERIILHSTNRAYAGERVLDITAAFREAGTSIYNPMPRPAVKLRRKGSKVFLTATNQPKGTTISVTGGNTYKQSQERVVLNTRKLNKVKVRFQTRDGRLKSRAATVSLAR